MITNLLRRSDLWNGIGGTSRVEHVFGQAKIMRSLFDKNIITNETKRFFSTLLYTFLMIFVHYFNTFSKNNVRY